MVDRGGWGGGLAGSRVAVWGGAEGREEQEQESTDNLILVCGKYHLGISFIIIVLFIFFRNENLHFLYSHSHSHSFAFAFCRKIKG